MSDEPTIPLTDRALQWRGEVQPRMRILICSANYFPEPIGVGKYSGEMAEWLAAAGHDVVVVSAFPYYPDWKVLPPYAGRLFGRETLNGVRIYRSSLWVPRRSGGLSRVAHLVSFAVTSAPTLLSLALFWRPQVCVTVAPFFTCTPAGLLACWLSGARSWLHVQDFEIDVAFGMGLLRGGLLKRSALAIERFLFRRFDRVSSISSKMVERLENKGVTPERRVFFRNWVDTEAVRPMSLPSAFRAELGLGTEAIVVLYSGALGHKQGLHVIPDVARQLAHRSDLQFVICGDGPMRAVLQDQCADLPSVHFLPLQPLARLGDLLNLADIHLLPQGAAAEDLVLPSKLTGMLSSGRPVVATCGAGTEMADIVSRCGCVVAPGDMSALAQAILQLADDEGSRKRFGDAARAYAVANLSRDSVLSMWERQLADLAGVAKVSPSCS